MQNIKIEPSTPIETLRKAGFVPDWMARDCELHGMYEAEKHPMRVGLGRRLGPRRRLR